MYIPDVGLGLLHPHLTDEVDCPGMMEGVLVGVQPEEGQNLFPSIELSGWQGGGVNLDTTKRLPKER